MRKTWKYAALAGLGVATLLARPTPIGDNDYNGETQPARTWQSKAAERREIAEYNLGLIRRTGIENTDSKALEYGKHEGLFTEADIVKEQKAYEAMIKSMGDRK